MIFSYNWTKEYLKGEVPRPKELAQTLNLHSVEVEEIKKFKNDYLLDLAILPNRAEDLASHYGLAREISLLTKAELQPLELEKNLLPKKNLLDLTIKVEDKSACPRYSALVLDNVEIKESPPKIKEKLISLGLEPINNIVDLANLVMLEIGQPLHAFDLEKIKDKIIVRFAKKGEKILALDEKEYQLQKTNLVIADKKGPIAIAGIKGGKETAISKETKRVLLESANFDKAVVRKSSKTLGLQTDASWRFERGVNFNLTKIALLRFITLLRKQDKNFRVITKILDIKERKKKALKIWFRLSLVNEILGLNLKEKEILKILKKLNFKVLKRKKEFLYLEIPEYRGDIKIPEDIVEEIGRIWGFYKIKATLPSLTLSSDKIPERNFDLSLKERLVSLGFWQVLNYSFISEQLVKKLELSRENLIELENPLSSRQKYLRPNLIANLLENASFNSRFFEEGKIFEKGKVFFYEKEPKEKEKLALVFWTKKGEDAFYQFKSYLEFLLESYGISDFKYFEKENEYFHKKKGAEIKVENKVLGIIGQIKPKILTKLNLSKFKVLALEIDFKELKKIALEEQIYQPFILYPAVIRDISLIVPLKTKVIEIIETINKAGENLVKDVDLFDIFVGENLPEGKKSLAFHIRYQREDRTLSSEEVDKVHQKIIKSLSQKGWQIR